MSPDARGLASHKVGLVPLSRASSTWKKHYQAEGLNRLRLGGSRPYCRPISANQRVSQPTAALGRRISRLYQTHVWRGLPIVAKTSCGSLFLRLDKREEICHKDALEAGQVSARVAPELRLWLGTARPAKVSIENGLKRQGYMQSNACGFYTLPLPDDLLGRCFLPSSTGHAGFSAREPSRSTAG